MLNIDDRLIKEVSPKIRPNALSVLLAIAIHLNQKNGRCFPSHERLMQLTGMGKNAVYDALMVLKTSGLLVSEQAIDSKNKKFGRRTFRLATKFIKIFVDASDLEPLPENREPENREPENREPENRETYQINNWEQINKFEQINKGEGNATLSPPFRKVYEIDIAVEAEKEKELPPSSGPSPLLVTTYTPQDPYTRVVEMVAQGPQTPGEKIRAMIADGNYKIKEVFSMNRRIPADKFDEYLTAFDREKTALPVPPTYKDANDLVSNFWNWSGIRWDIEQRAKQGGQQANTGRGATIVRSGGDPAKYEEKQVF